MVKVKVKIINLTPHEVTFVVGEEKVIYAPSGVVARCGANVSVTGSLNGIPVTETILGQVENLPDQ